MYPIPENEHLVENRVCKQCSIVFPITDRDMEFYSRVSPVFPVNLLYKEGTSLEWNGNETGDFVSEVSGRNPPSLDKLGIPPLQRRFTLPPPSLCPDCRQQRRLSYHNEKKLYNRRCDATGKSIISIYSPDKPYTVYHQDYWWSDAWDPMKYGREFDFSRGAFEQFGELMKEIPKQALIAKECENSEYLNFVYRIKNCYLIFAATLDEDCFFWNRVIRAKNCVDSLLVTDSENCYQCISVSKSYNCHYSERVDACRDSKFITDCSGCQNCYMCVNLTNKKYYIKNISYSPVDYKKELEKYGAKSNTGLLQEFSRFLSTQIRRANNFTNVVESSGENLQNTKKSKCTFDWADLEDVYYSYFVDAVTDSMDVNYGQWNTTLQYESLWTWANAYGWLFSINIWPDITSLVYCDSCSSSSHLFLCTWLRNKQYCILNKQYTKEKYEELVPRIIEHMSSPQPSPEGENILGTDSSSLKERAIGGEVEWGEFFPASMSPFGYNETVANEYYPLSREEVLWETSFWKEVPRYEAEDFQKWNRENPQSLRDSSFQKWALFNWSDYEAPFPTVEKIIPASKLPDTIEWIPNDILTWAIECEVSGRPFRIIKQELEFYRKHNLPIPRRHPDVRHMDRMKMRNPRKLFERFCDCPNCEVNWKKKGVILREGMDAGYFLLEEKIQGDSGTERRNPPSITTETGDWHLLSKGGLRKKMITTYSPERPETVYCEVCYEREVIS